MSVLAKRLRFASASLNVVFDGNSLVSGDGSTGGQNLPTQLAARAPLSGAGIPVTNLGISGQTTRRMNGLDGGSASDVDAAWVPGKANVLLVWEGINSMYNFRQTAAQAISDMQAYVANRLAANSWLVIALTTLPVQIIGASDANQIAQNAEFELYNATLRSTALSMGVQRVVDVRQSPAFTPANYTNAAFETLAANGAWASGETNGHVHLSNAGYGIVAGMCADALMRVRRRQA